MEQQMIAQYLFAPNSLNQQATLDDKKQEAKIIPLYKEDPFIDSARKKIETIKNFASVLEKMGKHLKDEEPVL